MKTSEMLLWGGLALIAYEVLLKPKKLAVEASTSPLTAVSMSPLIAGYGVGGGMPSNTIGSTTLQTSALGTQDATLSGTPAIFGSYYDPKLDFDTVNPFSTSAI